MNLFDRKSEERFIFNVFFVTLLGLSLLCLLVLGIVLLVIRCRRYREQKRREQLPSYSSTTNFVINRPPATDVVLGVYDGRTDHVYSDEIFSPDLSDEGVAPLYGDSAKKDDRARFYDANGWRGFAY